MPIHRFWPDLEDAYDPAQSRLNHEHRRYLDDALRGIGVVSGLAITTNSNMTVSVADGDVRYADGLAYGVTGDILTIGAAHATLDRFDLIYVDDSGVLGVLAGTNASPASSTDPGPLYPAITDGYVIVAAVFVQHNVSTILDEAVQDLRQLRPAYQDYQIVAPASSSAWIRGGPGIAADEAGGPVEGGNVAANGGRGAAGHNDDDATGGGSGNVTGGLGGDAEGAGLGGRGGDANVTGRDGGTSVSGVGGDGGDVYLTPGTGGVGGGGNGVDGNIIMSLPTSDPGVVGALWNDAGTVKISL